MTNAVPAYLQKYKKEAEVQSQSLADSSTSVPRISLKGKKFKLIEGGEQIGKTSLTLDVVILDAQPEGRHFIKTYYEGAFNPNDTSPPDCSSSDGIRPDGWVQKPEASHCATCPKNAFGSATSTSGKKAKACRDSKRLYVVLPDDIEGKVFILNIPVTSLRSLADYGRKIMSEGIPLFAVKTKLSMEEEQDYPVLVMETAGFLSEKDAEVSHARLEKHVWRSLPSVAGPGSTKAPAITDESVAAEVTTVKSQEAASDSGDVESVAGDW